MILLGTLCLLGGTATGFIALVVLGLGARNREGLAFALFSFGGGVSLFFMAAGLRRHRRWALSAGIVVTMLFMLVLESLFPRLLMDGWKWEVLGIVLLALVMFGVLLVQLFRSRRAIRLHELGATGRGFEVLQAAADPLQALPAEAEEEVRQRRWPIVACTALLLVVPCRLLYGAVFRAGERAQVATVERELVAALEQYFATLDPEGEIAQRFGAFTGLGNVDYVPGIPIAPDNSGPSRLSPMLDATARFDKADAPVTLKIRNGPVAKVEVIRLLPNLEHWQAKGWRVELRGAEFWAVPPAGYHNPDHVGEASPMRLELYGDATHPNAE